MDTSYKLPTSPGTPLNQVSPERVNQQRRSPSKESSGDMRGHARYNSVHGKVAAFNTLAMQSKQLERKANDAALQRAMLGREEAENEMRKWRQEVEGLKKQVLEFERRERKVGERLEQYMEKYASAKELHANALQLMEKDNRRVRKDYWRLQSRLVEEQEKLLSSTSMLETSHAELVNEKGRNAKREQEAFTARYELVGVKEELAQMQQRVKLVEQERDALRTIAQAEEVARIAAEGRLPLPVLPLGDEFASPRKVRRSLDLITITSSAASEEELDNLRMRLAWEKQRADRAWDQVEFLQAECRMKCCAGGKTRAGAYDGTMTTEACSRIKSGPVKNVLDVTVEPMNIFSIPCQPIFQTASPLPEESGLITPVEPATNFESSIFQPVLEQEPPYYARTPSCEPPAPAVFNEVNASLLSLVDVPQSLHHDEQGLEQQDEHAEEEEGEEPEEEQNNDDEEADNTAIQTVRTISTTTRVPLANPPDLTPIAVLAPRSANAPISPTVSREEALAMIRERRGRARSLAQGTLTPRKKMVDNGIRRDISAPAFRSGNVRGRSQVRA